VVFGIFNAVKPAGSLSAGAAVLALVVAGLAAVDDFEVVAGF